MEKVSLYDHYKNTPKKLKIVCDWDEVIQTAYPYACYLAMLEAIDDERQYSMKLEHERVDFPTYFNNYWQTGKNKYGIKNPPDIYHQMPFLTIAEDLLKLIKEDKVEELIFLSTSDDRKYEVFKETFLKLREIDKVCLRMMTDEPQYRTKAEWIKENAPNFDIFIDDDPENCRGLVESNRVIKPCEDCAKYKRYNDINCKSCEKMNITVIAPYYPAIESQHHKEVLLVKNEVSELKKEGFKN